MPKQPKHNLTALDHLILLGFVVCFLLAISTYFYVSSYIRLRMNDSKIKIEKYEKDLKTLSNQIK